MVRQASVARGRQKAADDIRSAGLAGTVTALVLARVTGASRWRGGGTCADRGVPPRGRPGGLVQCRAAVGGPCALRVRKDSLQVARTGDGAFDARTVHPRSIEGRRREVRALETTVPGSRPHPSSPPSSPPPCL